MNMMYVVIMISFPVINIKNFRVLDYPIDKKLQVKIRTMKLPNTVPLQMEQCCFCGHLISKERLTDNLLKIIYEYCCDVACIGINKEFGVEDQNYFLNTYVHFI